MFKGACKILYVKKFLRNLYILLEFSNLLYEMGQDFLDSQYKGMERIFDLNRYPAQCLVIFGIGADMKLSVLLLPDIHDGMISR